MTDNKKYLINIILFSMIILLIPVISILQKDKDISLSERRKLQQFPNLSIETVFSASNDRFMDKFESYTCDQFPAREQFRSINSLFSKYVFFKLENNKLNYKDSYISKIEYQINKDSYDWSINRIQTINNKYLNESNVFMSIIPDKNYYLNPNGFYATYDYDFLYSKYMNEIPDNISFIDIRDELSKEDYYHTDTHWKQECLIKAAKKILKSINNNNDINELNNMNIINLSKDFKGVYYGQLALPTVKDELNYLDGEYIKNLKAYCYDSGKAVEIPIYDFEKINGLDPYEIYLTGSKALITIENPNFDEDKELIIFRDSFGSSIAPLLACTYSKVTLVDIRYISPMMLDKYMNFKNCDVLFLYSCQVLNNSVGQFNN